MFFKTLFLIDDDADDQEIFSAALNEVNPSIICYTAINGYDALNQLQTKVVVPDLIFLDLNMPRMDGMQFLKAIKQNESLAAIPVIVYSTSANPKDKKETNSLGAIKFITKKEQFCDLCNLLKSILNSTSLSDLLK